MFLRRNERGSAILGVLGVMGVTVVIGVTVTTASLHAVGITTSTRASVEAEAAAEAGIDFAASQLATPASVCQPTYSSSTAPVFSVVVSYSDLPTSSGTMDTSWKSGCPTTDTNAQRLKLVSTGTASTAGVAGNTTGNIRKVEAIYPYTPSPPSYTIVPSGPATYSYSQVDSTINNLTITQAGTVRPTVVYLSGSATCTSDSQITGDVILGGGGLSITSDCTINGDLSTAGVVSIQSGEVTGNVNAAGVQSGTSVSLSNSAVVDGSIYGAGPVSIDGKIGGNVVAGPVAGTSTFSNKSSVGGSVVSAGTVSNNGSIKGSITQNKTGIVTPTVPLAPPWVDYAYSPNDWVASNGSPYSVLTMTSCSASDLSTGLAALAGSATPMILDTRVCGTVTNFSSNNMTLTSDSVILANGFKFSSNNIQASSAPDKRLWIIIPDTVPDGQPTCPSGSSANIGNNVQIGPHVAAMIYSPCAISNGGDVWTGQMYSSSIGTSSSFVLNFLQIGLPTVNLSTGQLLPPTGTGVLGNRTSIRDLVSP